MADASESTFLMRLSKPLVVLAFVLICTTSAFSWITFARLERANALVDHSQKVIAGLHEIVINLTAAAARERAFLIGGDPFFVDAYNASRQRLTAAVGAVRSLVADNPEQSRRIEELQRRMTEGFALIDADLAQAKAGAPLPDMMATKEALDGVYNATTEMTQAETILYGDRTRNAATTAAIAQALLAGGTVLSIGLIGFVLLVMRADAERREVVKGELRRLNARLAEDVATRTAELSSTSDALKLKDEDLVRTRAFLKLVIEHVPGMLFIKDAREHRFVLVNRGAEDLLGYDRTELIGKTDHEVFPREQADQFLARDRRVLKSGQPETILDEVIATRDRGVLHLQTRAVPVIDEKGQAQFLLGFSEDITDKRQVEQQLRQAQKMEAIGQLTGGVAHDFNNLLMVILGNLELLEVALDKQPALLGLVKTAVRGADRGAALVKSLLAFARKQPLDPTRVDMSKLLRETVEMLTRTIGENIEIGLSVQPATWDCEVDPGQIQSALLNLAINARDAMPSGGKLTLETANTLLDEATAQGADIRPGEYVMLAVSDTGTGIPAAVMERVFDPFFTTKEPGKGSGLGLSMVYGVVKQSRGHVKIYSEVGQGTTVRIYLPRMHDTARLELVTSTAPLRTGKETILVVEDDADVRSLAETMLTSLGYRVLQAGSGEEALAVLSKQAPDLLLTDVILPGAYNGRDLAEKALKMRPTLKVVYMSGYTESAVVHHGRLDAGVMLLQKPFRKQELAEKIGAVLEQTKSARLAG